MAAYPDAQTKANDYLKKETGKGWTELEQGRIEFFLVFCITDSWAAGKKDKLYFTTTVFLIFLYSFLITHYSSPEKTPG